MASRLPLLYGRDTKAPTAPAMPTAPDDIDQHQVQVVPIAPQVNLQNVAVLPGSVSDSNANNTNTGQAAQQAERWPAGSRARVAAYKGDGGSSQAGWLATRAIRGSCRSFRSLRR